jgi:hypothetical protein
MTALIQVSSQKAWENHVFRFTTAEAVLPLGGQGGRLGRQISGGGKFFEKKK